jgi:hypothetical protein
MSYELFSNVGGHDPPPPCQQQQQKQKNSSSKDSNIPAAWLRESISESGGTGKEPSLTEQISKDDVSGEQFKLSRSAKDTRVTLSELRGLWERRAGQYVCMSRSTGFLKEVAAVIENYLSPRNDRRSSV